MINVESLFSLLKIGFKVPKTLHTFEITTCFIDQSCHSRSFMNLSLKYRDTPCYIYLLYTFLLLWQPTLCFSHDTELPAICFKVPYSTKYPCFCALCSFCPALLGLPFFCILSRLVLMCSQCCEDLSTPVAFTTLIMWLSSLNRISNWVL